MMRIARWVKVDRTTRIGRVGEVGRIARRVKVDRTTRIG